MSVWEQLEQADNIQANDKPIWAINPLDKKNEKQVHKWLINDLQGLRQEDWDRVQEILRHHKLYKGLSADRIHRRDDNNNDVSKAQVQRKVVLNYLYDATEQGVSYISKYKPAVQFMPANDEFKDKQASKLAAGLFNYIKYVNDFDMKAQMTTRNTKIAGGGFLFITWDKSMGPQHPAYKKAVEEEGGTEITLRDDSGNPVKDDSGKQVKINKPVHIGEIKMETVNYEKLFFERFDPGSGEEPSYFYRIERQNVYEVRADYPDKADDIHESKDSFYQEYYKYNSIDLKNSTVVYEFYHKPSPYFEKGCYIKFTDDCVLEIIEYPYEHGEFPFASMTDIDVPNEMHPRSNYVNLRQINAQINNLITMKIRNIKLMASPKWMVPKGSVKLDQLGNNTGIVQYQGVQPPQIAKFNTTPNEVTQTQEQLVQVFDRIAANGQVSQGNPPPGVTAGVALQFLQEQEHNKQNSFVQKYNRFVRKVADLSLKTAAQYYDETDERLILVLGKNEEYSRVPFDMDTLATAFDIRIQNSSALPESKASRIQTIIDLNGQFPGLVGQEQVVDMIDFGQSDKWYNEAAAATRTAERENEKFMNSEVRDPQEWEYHVEHWVVHVKEMQKPGFQELPEEIQQIFFDHIIAHEMMLYQKAQMSPLIQQKLQMIPDFPLLYVPGTAAEQPSQEPVNEEMQPGSIQAAVSQEMATEEQVAAEMAALEQGITPPITGEPMPEMIENVPTNINQ